MVTFTPRAQDHYAVRVTSSCAARFPIAGGVFATRAAALTYATPFLASDRAYLVTATCPTYDRTHLDNRSAYTGRPYRQGDPIETDDLDPGFGDEF